MASTGGTTKKPVNKDGTTRAEFIKEIQEFYNKQKKKWAMKDVSLNFHTSTKDKWAGAYWGSGKKSENKGNIGISLPATRKWSEGHMSEGRITSMIAEGKKIIRHEMAHHRQRLKEDVGRGDPEGAHGPKHKTQIAQMGGRSANQKPPKKLRRKGPGGRPRARMSRKNIARGGPVRTGPPRDAPIRKRRKKNQGNRTLTT